MMGTYQSSDLHQHWSLSLTVDSRLSRFLLILVLASLNLYYWCGPWAILCAIVLAYMMRGQPHQLVVTAESQWFVDQQIKQLKSIFNGLFFLVLDYHPGGHQWMVVWRWQMTAQQWRKLLIHAKIAQYYQESIYV